MQERGKVSACPDPNLPYFRLIPFFVHITAGYTSFKNFEPST